jgi:hypothetical protein
MDHSTHAEECGFPHVDLRGVPMSEQAHSWEPEEDMAPELTVDQTREIVSLRRRHPDAQVIVHHKDWGLIVEARRSGHAIELRRFDWTGAVTPDRQIASAA